MDLSEETLYSTYLFLCLSLVPMCMYVCVCARICSSYTCGGQESGCCSLGGRPSYMFEIEDFTSLEFAKRAMLASQWALENLQPPPPKDWDYKYVLWHAASMLALGVKPKSPACIASTLLIKASPSHSATIFDDQTDPNRSYGKFKKLPVSQVRCSESMAGLCFFRLSIPTWKTELNPCAN